jgi:2-amino-4-hydroxy-6-hydroxymethyldihydropteridine diphosphokinase
VTVTTYLIALGSNRPGRHGAPRDEIAAAAAALRARAMSPMMDSAALGPSIRRFVNAVALVDSAFDPPAMLAACKAIERGFGRRRGRRWGARVIDLDIISWSGGRWCSPGLEVPHRALRQRRFVLEPLVRIAPDWRDPVTSLTARHLLARLTRSRPVPRPPSRW